MLLYDIHIGTACHTGFSYEAKCGAAISAEATFREEGTVYTTKERHDLLDELANKYKDDEASVKTIYSHWDEEDFDEGDYEELVGVLQLFSPEA